MKQDRFLIFFCVGVILITSMKPMLMLFILFMLFFIFIVKYGRKQRILENKIAAEKREEETRKSEEKRKRAKETEQSEKQSNDWVRDLRRSRIISKGPELNRIVRSVFGDIGMFDINEIDGKLSFRADLGHFSINYALSRDYESILDELENKKRKRENALANKVADSTNLDSRSSKSYSRRSSNSKKSRFSNNYPTDDDINSVDGGPPSEVYDDDDDG